MTQFRFFERQMACYAACHQDRRNRVTHLFGVPIIIFSLLIPLSLWRWPIADIDVSAAALVAAAALALWLALDLGIGAVLALLLLPVFLLAEAAALRLPSGWAWILFGLGFVGGWALQLLGHRFEGRKPALVDNLFQILIAPMYMAAELLFTLGLRADLAARIEACRRTRDQGRDGVGA